MKLIIILKSKLKLKLDIETWKCFFRNKWTGDDTNSKSFWNILKSSMAHDYEIKF